MWIISGSNLKLHHYFFNLEDVTCSFRLLRIEYAIIGGLGKPLFFMSSLKCLRKLVFIFLAENDIWY
jgi:hypothetical protein